MRRLLALIVVAVGSITLLSACGQQGGQALARQACAHVTRSLTDYERSSEPGTSAAQATQLQIEGAAQLRAALPLAASANSDDGSWNTLMTDLSEASTVDIAHLIPSLRAQCVEADTNVNVNPQNVNPN